MRKKFLHRVVFGAGCFLLIALVAMAASLPQLRSYPAVDAGWSFVGNATPLGQTCVNGCLLDLPDNAGNYTAQRWWIKDNRGGNTPYETQIDELLQVQSNLQNSWASYVVNLPTTQQYKIAVSVQGAQSPPPNGGNLVYPVLQITVNGTPLNICQYPGNNPITVATTVLVDQRGKGLGPDGSMHEYVTTCSTQLFAGNNTVAVNIIGGQFHGGQLKVRQVDVFPAGNGVQGRVACYSARVWHDAGLLSGTDLFALNTAARNWATATCGAQSLTYYVNLTGDLVNGSGCNNGASTCKMLEMY